MLCKQESKGTNVTTSRDDAPLDTFFSLIQVIGVHFNYL